MKRILTFSLWIDSLVLVSLLSRSLFPNFAQASYFESAACLFISIICVLMGLGILVFACKPKKEKFFKDKKTKVVALYDWISDTAIIIACIYSSHYIIGVSFFFLKVCFKICRDMEKNNDKVSRTVSTRCFRAYR